MSRPLLLVITGPSAAGKSTLLKTLRSFTGRYSTHVQGTDRLPRPGGDDPDVECHVVLPLQRYAFVYESSGHRYGIEAAQIDGAMARGTHHAVICNDVPTVLKLRARYAPYVTSIFLDCDLGEPEWRELQRGRGLSPPDIHRRWQEAQVLRAMQSTHVGLFSGVIVNSFHDCADISAGKMLTQLEQLVTMCGTRIQSRTPS